MARPKAKQLTERELEIMHVFWRHDECGVAEIQAELEAQGRPLAYTTVSTLVKILHEKGFLRQTNTERPFKFQAVRSFAEVSGRMVSDLVEKVFGGSREALLARLMEPGQLSAKERKLIESLLDSPEKPQIEQSPDRVKKPKSPRTSS